MSNVQWQLLKFAPLISLLLKTREEKRTRPSISNVAHAINEQGSGDGGKIGGRKRSCGESTPTMGCNGRLHTIGNIHTSRGCREEQKRCPPSLDGKERRWAMRSYCAVNGGAGDAGS